MHVNVNFGLLVQHSFPNFKQPLGRLAGVKDHVKGLLIINTPFSALLKGRRPGDSGI